MFWIKINVAKQVRFATFIISILDNFCLLQQYKLSKIKIWLPRLIINVPYGLIRDHSWLFHQPLKNKLAVVDRLFWQLGTCVRGRGRCREMAVSLDSTVFPLFFFFQFPLKLFQGLFYSVAGWPGKKTAAYLAFRLPIYLTKAMLAFRWIDYHITGSKDFCGKTLL